MPDRPADLKACVRAESYFRKQTSLQHRCHRQEHSLTQQFGNQADTSNLTVAVLGALDFLRAGVVVLDIVGRLLWANRAAQEILETGDGLQVNSAGILHLGQTGRPLPLAGILKNDWPAAQDPDPGVISVHRALGKRPLTLVVRPTLEYLANGARQGPAALVFVQDPEMCVHIPVDDLRQMYGLTPTEGSLANILMEGGTLEECCERLAIKPSTARMHFRNLLTKTGTRSQSELIGLLFRNRGMLGTAPAPELAPDSVRAAARSW
jgi:DNA-binding CsgD family transcriptional regulator/PAS domain-containing protein